MADDRPENTGSSRKTTGSFGRTGRPGPTIELEASRVERDANAATDAAPDAVVTGTANETTAAPVDPVRDSQPESRPELPSDANPDPAAAAAAGPNAAQEPVQEPAERIMAVPRPPSAGGTFAAAGAGAVAATAVVLLSSLLWPASPAPDTPPAAPPQVTTSMVDALNARLQRVETRPVVAPAPAIVTRPAEPDPALTGRLDELEKTVAALRGELTDARNTAASNAAAVTELKSAPPVVVPAPVDLTAINNRVSQVERAAGALKTQVTEQSAKPADDAPLRRVIAASLLEAAVRQGEPYAAPLATAKPLAADAARLAPLEGFAATGVPSAALLTRELQADLARLAPPPAATPANAGILERLEASAMRLVRVRRTDAVTGEGNTAIIGRISAAAKRGDLAEARREIDTLSPADRAGLQPSTLQAWAARYDARQAALATSHQFAADAMAALTKPAP